MFVQSKAHFLLDLEKCQKLVEKMNIWGMHYKLFKAVIVVLS